MVTYTRGEICTSRLSICIVYDFRVYSYPRKSACWTLSRVCAVRRRSNFPQRRYGCGFCNHLRTVCSILLIILHRHGCALSILPKTALFINLYKFFSKSFFTFLKFILSWMYSRSRSWRLRELHPSGAKSLCLLLHALLRRLWRVRLLHYMI